MYEFKKGFYSDVRIEDRFSTQIRLQNGQLHEAKVTTEKKAFVRVFDGKMWYYTSTDDIGSIQQSLNELYAYAHADKNIDANPIVSRYQTNKDVKIVYAEHCVKNVPLEEKLKLVAETDAKLTSSLCNYKSAQYLDRYSLYEFYSSKGADIKYDFQTCGVAYGLAFAHGDDTMQEQLSKARTEFSLLNYSDDELHEFVARCEDFILNAKPVQAGSYPVVLAPIVTGVFAHESFGHKSESDFMLGDEAMAKEWTLGKKVGYIDHSRKRRVPRKRLRSLRRRRNCGYGHISHQKRRADGTFAQRVHRRRSQRTTYGKCARHQLRLRTDRAHDHHLCGRRRQHVRTTYRADKARILHIRLQTR